MESSRVTNQSGDTTEDHNNHLLITMMVGVNPVKPESRFARTPRKDSIEK